MEIRGFPFLRRRCPYLGRCQYTFCQTSRRSRISRYLSIWFCFHFFVHVPIDNFLIEACKWVMRSIEIESQLQNTFWHINLIITMQILNYTQSIFRINLKHTTKTRSPYSPSVIPFSFPASVNKLGPLSSSYYRFDLMVRACSMPMAEQIIKWPKITGARPRSKRSAKWSLQMRIISATKGSILLRRWWMWDLSSFDLRDKRNMFSLIFLMCESVFRRILENICSSSSS